MGQATANVPMTWNELQIRLREFCKKRPIEKLEVFGSVAKETVTEESDVDLLATFSAGIPWGLGILVSSDSWKTNLPIWLASRLTYWTGNLSSNRAIPFGEMKSSDARG
jgi:hypothetical protein